MWLLWDVYHCHVCFNGTGLVFNVLLLCKEFLIFFEHFNGVVCFSLAFKGSGGCGSVFDVHWQIRQSKALVENLGWASTIS